MPTAPRMGPRDTFRAQIGRNLSIDKLTLNVADATICQSVKVSNTDTYLQLGHGFTRYTGTQSLANAKAAPQSRFTSVYYYHLLSLIVTCCSLSACISQSCPFFCLRPPTGFGISNATSIATATQQEEAITYCHDPSSHKVHRVMQCSTTTNKMSKVIDPQMDVQSILFRNLVTMVSCTNKVNTYQYWRDLAER